MGLVTMPSNTISVYGIEFPLSIFKTPKVLKKKASVVKTLHQMVDAKEPARKKERARKKRSCQPVN